MITDMRTYQKEDFDAVLELLNNNMEFDSMTANILKEKLFDDPTWNPESTFIAEIKECEIYHASKLHNIEKRMKHLKTENVVKWRNELLIAAFNNNQYQFDDLIESATIKYT